MSLPRTLAGYIVRFSGGHQAALAALSVVVFALSAVPLELQRRIVNEAIYEGAFQPILWLALGSAAAPEVEGLELSMMLSEVEPIGGFVGASVSEPLLQGGILAAVFGYMVYLEPWLAGASFLIFLPQLVFVPLMQQAINRRVQRRVLTARELSEAIVRQGAAGSAVDPAQQRRIDEVFTLHMGMYKIKFTMNFLMNLSHHLGVVAALAFGSWLVLHGRLEVGTVVAFISGLAKLNDPWGDLVNWFRDMTVNRVKYRLVCDALERMAGAASPLIDVHQDPRAPAA
jgi:ABC-type bacteriocin/lantibiotic exporter with double-glycine peptidase domain